METRDPQSAQSDFLRPAPGFHPREGLQLRLFGAMHAQVGDRPLPPLRSRKGLWLLALLALRAGREVDRAWLADTLWPDCEPERARRSLRQTLHDLRAALGDRHAHLAGDSGRSLRLDLDRAAVDTVAFDAALERGDGASLEAAIGLYRGPLLEGCAEEWVVLEREHREQGYLQALAALAGAASARHDPSAAAGYLRRAIATDPYREDLQRALMEALFAADSPSEALGVYREFRTLLWRQMAVEPAPETTRLFQHFRDGLRARARPPASRPVAAPPAPALRAPAIPVPLTALIGRAQNLRDVRARLESSRLVTLTGTGGIGKTRLALQLAHELAGEREDGVFWVPLAPLADGERVPDAIRSALAVPLGDLREAPLHALEQLLERRRLLLVLDNCEHLLEACAGTVEALLARCAGLSILTTSRQPLGLPGETVYGVPALALPLPGRSAVSTDSTRLPASVELFVERARAAATGFELTTPNTAAIVEICRRLEGIPLAIELAAARVRALSLDQIALRLTGDFALLAGGPALPPRHRTLAAAFDWSWHLLSPREQTLLRRLSVFAGGWTLEMAEAVCGDGEDASDGSLARGEVLALLMSLVEKSLALYRPAVGEEEPRYHLLEPVRACALARLRASPDRERIPDRHCDAYFQACEALHPKLWGPEQSRGFRQLETEHDNLRAALAWCRARGDVEKELRLAVSLCRFWDTHGHLREGRGHLKAALSRAPAGLPPALRAAALIHAGWMAYVAGDWVDAHGHYLQVLADARAADNSELIAKALNYRALVLVEEGDFAAARTHFEEALHRYCALGKTGFSVVSNLGRLALRQADYPRACEYLEQSVAGCARSSSAQEHGLALLDLSIATLHLDRLPEARRHATAALRLLHECGAVIDLPAALDQMACIAAAESHWTTAAHLLGAAEALREQHGLPASTSLTSDPTAAVRTALGPTAFAAAHATGKATDPHQAITPA